MQGVVPSCVAMSRWYVYPRDMCIPAHISLVICVPPVGIHKTLQLQRLQGKHDGYEGQNYSRDRFCGFQPIKNIHGRRSECNYWFEIVFGKCIARRQRLQARDTNITTITVQWYVYPNVSQNVCLPALRLWVLFGNILLIQNCTRLDRPGYTTIAIQWYDISDHIGGWTYHRTEIAVISVVY